jgi:hypothetical protein
VEKKEERGERRRREELKEGGNRRAEGIKDRNKDESGELVHLYPQIFKQAEVYTHTNTHTRTHTLVRAHMNTLG